MRRRVLCFLLPAAPRTTTTTTSTSSTSSSSSPTMDMGAAYGGRYMKKNQPVLVSGLTHALVHGLHNALTTGVVHSTAPPLTHAPAGGKSRLLCSPTACTRHRHELLWGLEGRSKATGVDAHLAFFSATAQARALYEPDVVAHALLLLHLLLLLPRLLPLLPALGVVQPGASAPPAAQASLGDMPPTPRPGFSQ